MNEPAEHSNDTVKEMAAKHREQLKKITPPLNDMITKLLQAHTDIVDVKKKVLNQQETVDKDIDQFFDNVIHKIEEQRQQLKQELHSKMSGVVQLQLLEVENVQVHLNDLARELDEFCDDDILLKEKDLVACFNEVTRKYNELKLESVKPDLYFIPSDPNQFPQFGHLGESPVAKRNYSTIPKPHKLIDINGQMGEVQGIAFSHNHHWAVTDFKNNCVYIFDEQDQLVKQITSCGRDAGEFINPFGLAFDDNNFLYMVNSDNGKVQKFDFTGQFILQFGEKIDPLGIAVNRNKVYLTDRKNRCIMVYQTDGIFCFSFGSGGSEPGQFSNPCGIAITSDDTLLVVDIENVCIQVFQLDGTFIQMFGTEGSEKGQLGWPAFLAIDHTGNILVTEYCNSRVSVFDKNYNYIYSFGSEGSGINQFDQPHGIAVAPNGKIYICDYGNKRVVVYK